MIRIFLTVCIVFIWTSCNEPNKNDVQARRNAVDSIPPLIKDTRFVQKDLDHLPETIKKFVINGYSALDTVNADINEDGTNDVILVLYSNKEAEDRKLERGLSLLLGQNDGTYKQACFQWEILPSREIGGFLDPYPGILAGKGWFTIQVQSGSNWKTSSITNYNYDQQKGDWLLGEQITENYFGDKEEYKVDTMRPEKSNPIYLCQKNSK